MSEPVDLADPVTCTAEPFVDLYEPERIDPSLTIPCNRPAVCRVITITGWYGGVYCQGHADVLCSADLDAGPVSLDESPSATTTSKSPSH